MIWGLAQVGLTQTCGEDTKFNLMHQLSYGLMPHLRQTPRWVKGSHVICPFFSTETFNIPSLLCQFVTLLPYRAVGGQSQ